VYATLLIALVLWWTLGLLTLFVGGFGLLAQSLVLALLAAVAFVAVIAAHHDPMRRAFVRAAVGAGVALVGLSACPNRGGPQVFFAVHGAQLDALARDGADAYCELWIDVYEGPGQDAPVDAEARALEALRARVRSAGARAMGVRGGEVTFLVSDGRGFVYLPPGVPPSIWGSHVGLSRAWLPPNWRFGQLEDDSEPPHPDVVGRRGLDRGRPTCR
jgi:hypothetical protein